MHSTTYMHAVCTVSYGATTLAQCAQSHTSKLSTSKIMQMENNQAFLWRPFSKARFIAIPDTRKTHSPYHEWLTPIPFEWIVSIFALLGHVFSPLTGLLFSKRCSARAINVGGNLKFQSIVLFLPILCSVILTAQFSNNSAMLFVRPFHITVSSVWQQSGR